MKYRKSRWVDNNGEKLDEHKHGHYNWHFIDTKHRSLRLDIAYPEVNKILRSASYLSLKAFMPFLADKLVEEHRVHQIGATVDKRGGPIEIYMDKLVEDTIHMGHTHWGWDFLDSDCDEGTRDAVSITLFMFFHDSYHIHEILHRMWHWETSHSQNKKRDKKREEDVVMFLSYVITTQLYNHLFTPPPDATWGRHKEMLKEMNQSQELEESSQRHC